MMSEDTREKVKQLPKWVQGLVANLEKEAEPNNHELRQLRQQLTHQQEKCKRTQERLDAVEHLMRCAAKGGHETAQAYVNRIINEYSTDTDCQLCGKPLGIESGPVHKLCADTEAAI